MISSRALLRTRATKFFKRFLEEKTIGYRFLSSEYDDVFKFYSDKENCKDHRPLCEEDYDRFISKRSSLRESAITRQITSLAYKLDKDFISLAEGMPNETVFPFRRLSVDLMDGEEFVLEGRDLVDALQYLPTQGKPELLNELRSLQNDLHRPPHPSNRDILITSGGQFGIYATMDLLLNYGDPILLPEYTYTGVHSVLKPYQPEILSIPEDEYGLNTDHLHALLESRLAKGLQMPRFMYVVPTGSNPSGTVLSEERRREIYDLACRYDFLIVEDDPYMFLNYTGVTAPSFLSLDETSRVIRLDSLSKVMCPGLRAGWLSAPLPLLRRLERHLQADHLHAASLTQALLTKLLHIWGREGIARQARRARTLYRGRRDALHTALTEHVLSSAVWRTPDAGMFFWLRLDISDVFDMVFKTAFEKGLMLIPGQACSFDTSSPSPYLRLAFGKINVEDMDRAARLLAEVIQTTQSKARKGDVQSAATHQ